jgi:surfactin synthase thioesterase subunit
VAVHGLGGHWDKTWSDSNGKNWLRDFLPEEFPNARIMAFGYDSKMFFSSSVTDIEDVACTLLNRLDGERDKRHKNRPIVFIAHSLGGIVVKKVSTNARLTGVV